MTWDDDQLEAARKVFDVATVQNGYNLADQTDADVLEHCEHEGIGFMPWFPLASGELSKPGDVVGEVAAAHGATPGQVSLASQVVTSVANEVALLSCPLAFRVG